MEQGADLYLWSTEKFKTTTVRVIVRQPLAAGASAGALLPMVLRRGTKQLPETILLARRLDELYGAELRADAMKFGEEQVLIFHLEVPASTYVGGADPLPGALDVLRDALLDPPREDGGLRDVWVAQERDNLARRIQGIYSDKTHYAQLRLVEEMCPGEPYAIPRLGTLEALQGETPQRLLARWNDILESAPIAIYIVGDMTEQQALEHARRLLPRDRGRRLAPPQPPTLHLPPPTPRRVEDVQDVAQGKLALGFVTNCRANSPDYPALVLMNGIYGGFSHSKLFQEVRERHSLAYYAHSQMDGVKGLLFVHSGIAFRDRPKAEELILEQLEEMCGGKFEEEELQTTLSGIESQILQSSDAPGEAIMTDFELRALGRPTDAESRIAALRAVDAQEIVAAAQRLRLDTVYFLRREEAEHGDGD